MLPTVSGYDPREHGGWVPANVETFDPSVCPACGGQGFLLRRFTSEKDIPSGEMVDVERIDHGMCPECGRVALASGEPAAPEAVQVMLDVPGIGFMVVWIPPRVVG